MAENDTLLAHLVTKYIKSSEDAATDALVYILNKSKPAALAFNSWIKTVVAGVEDCTTFRIQETEGSSRFDLVGYESNQRRVIGESKFWAGLGVGQGSGYLEQLADTGPAVLLFIVPEARINYLWPEVVKDVERGCEGVEGREVTPCDAAPSGIKKAVATGTAKYLVMVSWRALLSEILNNSAADSSVRSDIHQLQGLADRMDLDAFQPLHSHELGPDFARRASHYSRLVNDVVDRGVAEGWLDNRGLRVTPQEYGYGRYVKLSGYDVWFGVNIYQWGKNGDTPLWLNLFRGLGAKLKNSTYGSQQSLYEDLTGTWTPVFLKTDAELDKVLEDMVSQLKAIADVINNATTPPA